MNFDKCIYKFIKIDEYCFENLRSNELIAKHFEAFNDPYDAHHGIVADWPNLNRKTGKLSRETKGLKELIKNLEPERYSEITHSNASIIQYLNSTAGLVKYTHQFVSENSNKFRVCSFSRRWNHILMWSHYADGCRGVALIFDREKIPRGSNSRLLKLNQSLNGTTIPVQWVKYKHIPPLLNAVEVLESARIGTEEAINSITRKMLDTCALTKYKAWKYEQESRLIIRYDDEIGHEPVMYQYASEALKGAIIGHKCSPENVVKLASLMPEESIIYLTKPVIDRYKVQIIEQHPVKQIANGTVQLKMESVR
jgi:hypothetical protein